MSADSGFKPFILALALGATNCLFQPKPESPEAFSKAHAERMVSEWERRWSEPDRAYRYEYRYHSGLFASTQRGACEIADTVKCQYDEATGESGTSTNPGRIQGFFEKMKSMNENIAPDSIAKLGQNAFTIYQIAPLTDSSKVPYGYSVWFNAELGYPDSVFFLPFGPSLRILSLRLKE